MSTYTTHNDEAVLDCLLERKEFRARIREQILNAMPPKAIAIHGTWGTGKTSILKQLYRELGGEYALTKDEKTSKLRPLSKKTIEKVKPVWFEAWQYQHEANILAAMLKEIRDQLSWIAKLKNGILESTSIISVSILQSIDISFKAFGASFGIKNLGKNINENIAFHEQETMSGTLDSVKMKRLLKEGIDQLLGFDKIMQGTFNFKKEKRDKKVVIFIDDLDRCEPETVFRILESIKVYLNLENCVFVLGMDMKAVEESIAYKYEKLFERSPQERLFIKNKARLYLEKICQDVFLLPLLRHEKRSKLLTLLLLQEGNGLEVSKAKTILTLCKTFKVLPPFPRSIKIFANVILSQYNSQRLQAIIEKDDRSARLFIILAYLYAYHYELYQLVFLYEEDNFYNEQLYPFCKDPDKIKDGVKENHEILSNLIMPSRSKMSAQATDGTIIPVASYPHESLRQVFWIQKLIVETKKLTTADLETINSIKF